MPFKARKPCTSPGCPTLTDGGLCDKHSKQRDRLYDNQRYKQPWRQWSKSARWKLASNVHKFNNPFCRECERQGRLTPVYLTDHIIPHNGNYELFWDESNWQSLCNACHEEKHKGERWNHGH